MKLSRVSQVITFEMRPEPWDQVGYCSKRAKRAKRGTWSFTSPSPPTVQLGWSKIALNYTIYIKLHRNGSIFLPLGWFLFCDTFVGKPWDTSGFPSTAGLPPIFLEGSSISLKHKKIQLERCLAFWKATKLLSLRWSKKLSKLPLLEIQSFRGHKQVWLFQGLQGTWFARRFFPGRKFADQRRWGGCAFSFHLCRSGFREDLKLKSVWKTGGEGDKINYKKLDRCYLLRFIQS